MFLGFKYRIKDRRAAKALRAYAISVNQVWNYANAVQRDVEARYKAGAPKRRWPTNFDLVKRTSGTSKELGLNCGTISEVCRVYAQNRDKARRSLRFRASRGPQRALGWVPFRNKVCHIQGNAVTYLDRTFRVFGTRRRPIPENFKVGAFVEDSQGRWFACFQAECDALAPSAAGEIGIDLGLKVLATVSDGERIENPAVFRAWEQRLGIAQRAGNHKRVQAIHAKIANIRKDWLHKASARLAAENSLIVVGNVNAAALKKTWMAKSVSDAGWSMFRTQLQYKASRHGARYVEADERWTSRTCSSCGTIPSSSPKGTGALGIRSWVCCNCGASHDRDINAAINILRIGHSVVAREDGSRRLPDRRDIEDEGRPPRQRREPKP